MLHTILGDIEYNGCWWIMLASLQEIDKVLDTLSAQSPHPYVRPNPDGGFDANTPVILTNCSSFTMDNHTYKVNNIQEILHALCGFSTFPLPFVSTRQSVSTDTPRIVLTPSYRPP